MNEVAATAQDLGRAIAHLRGDRSQAAVAQASGLTRAAWSLYESGKRRPKERNFAKILRYLDCTQAELEELAWQFRRRRLAAEGERGSEAKGAAVGRLQGLTLSRQRTLPPIKRLADPELQALLAQLNAVLEQLLASLTKRWG